MKTQKQHLVFRKSSLVELNDSQMLSVDGGTTPVCAAGAAVAAAAVASSASCAAVGAAAVGAVIGFVVATNDAE